MIKGEIIVIGDRIYKTKEILIEQGRERALKPHKSNCKLFRIIDGKPIQIGIFRFKRWNFKHYFKDY